jgi:hypothetical protein
MSTRSTGQLVFATKPAQAARCARNVGTSCPVPSRPSIELTATA